MFVKPYQTQENARHEQSLIKTFISYQRESKSFRKKKSDVKYIPTQAEIGDYALFLGKASIEIKIEEKDYLIVSQSAILILIRDDLGRVLA